MTPAIQTNALRKTYKPPAAGRKKSPPAAAPPEIVALDALDLQIQRGELFGLLGPNGAGKTTTIGILTTRVRPTAGTAVVAGASVSGDPTEVRRRIGVVPQRPNADRGLNVVENLVFHATYFGVPRAEARRRALALLDRLGIADKREAKLDALSGGQQQRLMIARALSHEPEILFLDEPSVGLDPQARLDLWEVLRSMHAEGRTIIMTTHHMEEADQLCDRIAIIDRGKLLALDTPAVLKARAPGGTLIELVLDRPADELAVGARAIRGVSRVETRGATLRIFSEEGGRVISALIDIADTRQAAVRDIHIAEPSLETLFVSMTGRNLG